MKHRDADSSAGPALLEFVAWLLRADESPLPAWVSPKLASGQVCANRLASMAHLRGVEGFKEQYINQSLASEIWRQALEEVLLALQGAKVDACKLKGCAYFFEVYDDPAERPMGDLDILVRPQQFDRAARVLESLGFRSRKDKNFTYAPRHHARPFDRAFITVDLHRNMMQARRSRIDIAQIWKRADLGANRLECADEIVLHICHMIRSELMVPLISFFDLDKLLRRSSANRQEILVRSDRYRVGRGARLVFAMLDLLAQGNGGRAAPYPIPSALDIALRQPLSRPRQLAVKALLTDGPLQLLGLAHTTLSERVRKWKTS